MPLYTYRCNKCQKEIEKVQFFNGIVPQCCGTDMMRLPSFNIMVIMKGEGGYPSRRKQIFNTTMRNHPKLT